MACEFCAAILADINSSDMELEKIKRIIDRASFLDCKYICFSGGEPLLHPDIIQIINYAHLKGFWITVTTNGSLIERKLVDAIKGKNLNIRISLHTLIESKFNSMTKSKLFRNIIENINLLRQHKVNFSLGATIYNSNISEIIDIADFAYQSGATYIRFTPVAGVQKGKDYETDSLFYEKALRIIFQYILSNKSKIKFESSKVGVPDNFLDIFTTRECAAASEAYYIYNSDSKIQACQFLPHDSDWTVEESAVEELLEAANKLKMKKCFNLRELNVEKFHGRCKTCEYKNSCKGGCIANKVCHGLDVNAVQPICLNSILHKIIDVYPLRDKEFLLEYWYFYFQNGFDTETGNYACIRKSPVWELHFNQKLQFDNSVDNAIYY